MAVVRLIGHGGNNCRQIWMAPLQHKTQSIAVLSPKIPNSPSSLGVLSFSLVKIEPVINNQRDIQSVSL